VLVVAAHLDPALLQVRREPPFGRGEVDELEGHAINEIVLGIEEGEPARLHFLDDIDLDAVDHRQPPAVQPGRECLRLRVVSWRGLVVELLAEAGVALEHHAR